MKYEEKMDIEQALITLKHKKNVADYRGDIYIADSIETALAAYYKQKAVVDDLAESLGPVANQILFNASERNEWIKNSKFTSIALCTIQGELESLKRALLSAEEEISRYIDSSNNSDYTKGLRMALATIKQSIVEAARQEETIHG